jgi:hypothetical protein
MLLISPTIFCASPFSWLGALLTFSEEIVLTATGQRLVSSNPRYTFPKFPLPSYFYLLKANDVGYMRFIENYFLGYMGVFWWFLFFLFFQLLAIIIVWAILSLWMMSVIKVTISDLESVTPFNESA